MTMKKRETLQEYVCRILEAKGLSGAKVSRYAEGRISTSLISNLVTGKSSPMTVSKLQALARGLGVSEEEIFSIARGVEQTAGSEFSGSEFARMFNKYLELSEDDKKNILLLLEMVEHEIERRRTYGRSNLTTRVGKMNGHNGSDQHLQGRDGTAVGNLDQFGTPG